MLLPKSWAVTWWQVGLRALLVHLILAMLYQMADCGADLGRQCWRCVGDEGRRGVSLGLPGSFEECS